MKREGFGDLGEPDAGFDAYQLRTATSSVVFRDDDELQAVKEDLEWVIRTLQTRLAMMEGRQ
jgi:hypothetical protein